jgi:hypothetical protein
MENTVIKVLTKEHGAKVIKWWESQGVDTSIYTGTICESEGYESIYYGVINGNFGNYSRKDVDRYNAKIIELPEEEFDMSTNEGRLAYAKKHYPVGTVIKSIYTDTKLKLTSEPRIYLKTTIISESSGRCIDVYHAGLWAKIIEGEQQEEEKVMETQKLSRQGLKEIHSVACTGWKSSLELLGANNPLEDYIELNQDQVDAMFKACTATQLPIVSKYLKQDDGSVDIMKFKCEIYDTDGRAVIEKRFDGEYAHKSLFLRDVYDWEIKQDSKGYLCLIPTKKK